MIGQDCFGHRLFLEVERKELCGNMRMVSGAQEVAQLCLAK